MFGFIAERSSYCDATTRVDVVRYEIKNTSNVAIYWKDQVTKMWISGAYETWFIFCENLWILWISFVRCFPFVIT